MTSPRHRLGAALTALRSGSFSSNGKHARTFRWPRLNVLENPFLSGLRAQQALSNLDQSITQSGVGGRLQICVDLRSWSSLGLFCNFNRIAVFLISERLHDNLQMSDGFVNQNLLIFDILDCPIM